MPHMGVSSPGARRSVGEFSPLCFCFILRLRRGEVKPRLFPPRGGEKGETSGSGGISGQTARGFEVGSSCPRSLLGACPTFPRFPAGAKREKGHDMCASLDPPLVLGIRGNFFSFSPLSLRSLPLFLGRGNFLTDVFGFVLLHGAAHLRIGERKRKQ